MSDLATAPLTAGAGQSTLCAEDGCELFFRWARPAQPQGVLLVVHGLGEHSGRYQALAEALVAGGFAYYGYDLRGHGLSGGPRGDIRRFGEYTEDLGLVAQEVRRREGGRIFLLGHSLGGVVAVIYALDHQPGLAGLVAASTAFQPASPPAKLSLLGVRLLSFLTPHFRVGNNLKPEDLSTDHGEIAQYQADPLVQRRVTVSWVNEFFSHHEEALERACELSLPLLVLHGGDDRIASLKAARTFFERAGSADKTFRLFPGLRHELYSESPEKRRLVFADLLKWLAAHLKV
jgi:alpha-beta hydrolase superfamily lysophospholipase